MKKINISSPCVANSKPRHTDFDLLPFRFAPRTGVQGDFLAARRKASISQKTQTPSPCEKHNRVFA